MEKNLYRLSVASLFCIFLVVLAGGVVRMTGSGMGCPDWPKCFGYYIPPTTIDQLTWEEGKIFKKGQIIIREEALWVAKMDFTTGTDYDPAHWEKYTKHDYARFNAAHTWTEYINRLTGALSGLPVFLMAVFSIFYAKRDPLVTLLSILGLALLLFEAWLGKVVVDGNLIAHQITYHMLGAVLLVAIYTYLVIRLKPIRFGFQPRRSEGVVKLGVVAILVVLAQVVVGTAVREDIDMLSKMTQMGRNTWIDQLGLTYYIHRSFSIVVALIVGLFAIRIIQTRTISAWPRVLLVGLGLEILAGIGLAYLNFPPALQPLHLVLGIGIFAVLLALTYGYYRRTLPG